MKKRIIYHGSKKEVIKPLYRYELANKTNDYGLGFYCTEDLEIAKEWANKDSDNGVVNVYEIDENDLKILDLTDKHKYSVLNWIAILLSHRNLSQTDRIKYKKELEYLNKYLIDITGYDTIIGFRADDAYFRFPLMFIKNILTIEKLEEMYLLGDLGKQYVLISEKSFHRIKYIKSIKVNNAYNILYKRRLDDALKSYTKMENEEKISKGKRIKDLMENDL